ncbi:MAG TPA: L-histidine N(alpha)-methyltransferase [Pyrinomonadaceae bacterium]|nr:L-histidine N(alpha)-methyltransferase [Pyrinomonadaceae bacterium]
MQTSSGKKHDTFAEDILKGLSSQPKFLSSKYFYDDEGSRLFQKIMELPEYYLTRSEFEIFQTKRAEIFEAFTQNSAEFDLIELGAGDGTKTAVLIDYFLKQNVDFTYSPIDISQEAVDILTEKFKTEFPDLNMNAKVGDYFRILETLKAESKRPKILMFLGSNIGNFSREDSISFFKNLRDVMNENDLLFTGFDLQKDPHVILAAYDDAQGVTAKFNINLLRRINRELGANFDLEKFSHYAIYRPNECAARSFLISREEQDISIKTLNKTFHFKAWEPIFMEISQKYSLEIIENFAETSGFEISENFFDSRKYFVDSLWRISAEKHDSQT